MTALDAPPRTAAWTPRPLRSRVADGASYVRLLAVTGVVTVLVTRAFLVATGYPRVGGGGLHISHVLWGGLLMLAALTSALLFVGSRRRTAVLGGIGFGLFVDEIGKFVTNTYDYLFPLAAVIIYLAFAALLVLAALLGRDRRTDRPARTVAAAQAAVDGLARGLTPRQREAALGLVDADRGDPVVGAVLELLDAAPRRPPTRAERLTATVTDAARRLADVRHVPAAALGLFLAGRVVVFVVFAVQLGIMIDTGHRPADGTRPATVLGITATGAIATALAGAGALRWRHDRPAAYRWFHAAVLVDLLVIDVLEFADSQFRATASLPYDLLVLALVAYGRRTYPAPPDPAPAA